MSGFTCLYLQVARVPCGVGVIVPPSGVVGSLPASERIQEDGAEMDRTDEISALSLV